MSVIKKFKSRIIFILPTIFIILINYQNDVQNQMSPVRSAESLKDAMAETPIFPYGGVYFRKSNPPKQDWENDHKIASDLGANTFRHWFMWSVIEVAPGIYDWEDYDRQMDLAAQNGIKVIIGEISNTAPEWMYDKYPHARRIGNNNTVGIVSMGASAVTGFAPMCLDNEEILRGAEKFQKALIERYRDHPAMLGYDLWNEMHMAECYCEATQVQFREWLKKKYGTLEALGKAWHRYSIGSWDNLHPSHQFFGGYPDAMDWIEFESDNKYRLLHRRAELFKSLDKKNLVTGHSAFVASAASITSAAYNDWRDAEEFDVFGFTYVSSRNGNEPWMLFTSVDFTRAASRGKPFWHAEAEAGSLWMQPQVTGRAREDGRISDAKDVRFWNQVSMAGGATGILYPRWRPLLDGPLWAAFGPMNLDGSVGPKAEMAGKVAIWANANSQLWKSSPVKGDIGIIWLQETVMFNNVKFGSTQHYAESTRGAYQAFFDSNIQADYVHIDHIAEYPVLYLPYPVMLKQQTADKLIEYVKNGGKLICEGLPGYFGDGGHVGVVQPNLGLDQLFGAKEKYVEFTPDLLEDLTLEVRGNQVIGRYFLQEYITKGGTVVGTFKNGSAAAVENSFGNGKTLLIGSYPGAGYFKHHSPETKQFFSGLLDWADVNQGVISSDGDIKARLHKGEGGTYLWVLNPSRDSREVTISLTEKRELKEANDLWAATPISIDKNSVTLTIGDRDAAIIKLQ
jgi:beta-galactosidase